MTTRSVARPGVLLACTLLLGARQPPPAQVSGQEWRAFEGTWSASGTRHALPTESGDEAAIVQLSGAVVLSVDGGLGPGFHGRAIGFQDGAGHRIGRAVWTDERGDSIFSTFGGGLLTTGERFTGTITGGTGRFAGATGEYAFTWQYVVRADEGVIQGRAVGLTGKVRRGAAP
jgi:hypothetical protein